MLNNILYSIFSSYKLCIPFDVCNNISSFLSMELYYMPADIIQLIEDYIPYKYKILYSKKHYMLYHKFATFKPYDSYLRYIIRNDMYFVLNVLFTENMNTWLKKNKKLFKKYNCDAYIKLLNNWCIEYKSNKCRNIIIKYIK